MVATAIANNPDHELRREAIMWMEAARARNLRFLGRVDEALPMCVAVSDGLTCASSLTLHERQRKRARGEVHGIPP